MQFFSFAVIGKRIKAIKFMMRDKSVPLRKKALVVFGIVYLFLPVDLIPPVLFPFGFLDDLVLWIYILFTLKETLDRYWVGEKEVPPEKKYRGKNVIDDVNFEVKDDRCSGPDQEMEREPNRDTDESMDQKQ